MRIRSIYVVIVWIICFTALGFAYPDPPHLNVTEHHLSPDVIWTIGSGKEPYESVSVVGLTIEGVGDPTPVDVVLAIDYSATMNESDPCDKRLDAAKCFVGCMNSSRDRIGLVCWNDTIIRHVDLTNNFSIINISMCGIEPRYETDFNLALNKSIDILNINSLNLKKYIIFLSDGEPDLHDKIGYIPPPNPDSPVVRAKNESIEIWTIGYVAKPRYEKNLVEISDYTHGKYYAANITNVTDVFQNISKNITTLAGEDVTVRYLAPADLIYSIPHDHIEGPNKVFIWNSSDFSGDTYSAVSPNDIRFLHTAS